MPAPTAVHLSVTPNPAPEGEWISLHARVEPNPGVPSTVEFVYLDENGGTWSTTHGVNVDGVATDRFTRGPGTVDVTANYYGSDGFAPSTTATVSLAIVQRIIATPGFRIDVPVVHAFQTVPFTAWASPAPLTGTLRVSGGPYLRSEEFSPAQGEVHGTLSLGHGSYEIWAELLGGWNAQGCPLLFETQLRPSDPRITASTDTVVAGTPVTFDLEAFDPAAIPGLYGHMSATLRLRHEDGRDEIPRQVDISTGGGTASVSPLRPGRYEAWFTLPEYVWSESSSNHVVVDVLPSASGPFSPMPAAKPGSTPTSIALADLPSTAWKNDLVPFQATIDPPPTGGRVVIQDGTVEFALLTATATPGVYRADVYRMPAGPHKFRAVYDGSDSHAPSASAAQELFAESITTTTTLSYSPAHPDVLTPVTLTATVSPVPSGGRVFVYRDGAIHLFGNVDLQTGQASWTETWQALEDPHQLKASFEDGGPYADSHSAQISLEITPVPATATLNGPTEIAHAGQQVEFAIQVAPVVSTGTIAFFVDGELVGDRGTSSATNSWRTSSLRPGQHRLQVRYSTGIYAPGWSNELVVNVGPYSNRAPIHGTVVANSGNPYANSEWILIEPTLDPDSYDARVFQLSNDGVRWATFPYDPLLNNSLVWRVTDPRCGGTPGTGEHRVYYRWSDYWDWDHSPVESVSITITGAEESGVTVDAAAPYIGVPVVSTAPQAALPSAQSSFATVSWTGTDDLSGIASYELEQSIDGGEWEAVARSVPSANSERLELQAGKSHLFRVRGRDRAGNLAGWSTSSPFIPAPDSSPPNVFAPVASVVGNRSLSANPIVRISWPAGTDQSGVASYRLEKRVNSGSWTQVSLPTPLATTVDVGLKPGANVYRFRLRATDTIGYTSAYALSAGVSVARIQEGSSMLRYAGSWRRVSLAGASGGYVSRAALSGASATYSFTGRWVAIATTLGPNRGVAVFRVDGTAQTVDLYSPTVRTAWLALSVGVASTSHTVRVEVTGQKNAQSSGARVDLDALIVLR